MNSFELKSTNLVVSHFKFEVEQFLVIWVNNHFMFMCCSGHHL